MERRRPPTRAGRRRGRDGQGHGLRASARRISPKTWSPSTSRTSSCSGSTSVEAPTGRPAGPGGGRRTWAASPLGRRRRLALRLAEADLDQRAGRPLAVGQRVAVDGQLGASGPNRTPSRCQPGFLASRWTARAGPPEDWTARLSSDQPSTARSVSGPLSPRKRRSTNHCCAGGDLARVVKGELEPPRADRLGQPRGDRRAAGRQLEALLAGERGARSRRRARRRATIAAGRASRTRLDRPGPRPAAGPAKARRGRRPPDGRPARRPGGSRSHRPSRAAPRSAGRAPGGPASADIPGWHRPPARRSSPPPPSPEGPRLAARRGEPEPARGVADDPAVNRCPIGTCDRLQPRPRLPGRGPGHPRATGPATAIETIGAHGQAAQASRSLRVLMDVDFKARPSPPAMRAPRSPEGVASIGAPGEEIVRRPFMVEVPARFDPGRSSVKRPQSGPSSPTASRRGDTAQHRS